MHRACLNLDLCRLSDRHGHSTRRGRIFLVNRGALLQGDSAARNLQRAPGDWPALPPRAATIPGRSRRGTPGAPASGDDVGLAAAGESAAPAHRTECTTPPRAGGGPARPSRPRSSSAARRTPARCAAPHGARVAITGARSCPPPGWPGSSPRRISCSRSTSRPRSSGPPSRRDFPSSGRIRSNVRR
jgi:hypothetical protein